jgi:hypothetical protein
VHARQTSSQAVAEIQVDRLAAVVTNASIRWNESGSVSSSTSQRALRADGRRVAPMPVW